MLGDKPSKKGSKEREPGKKKLLMVTTELGDVLRKTSMDNSTLASTLCDLWDENDYSKPLPGGGHTDVDCRLSWMGGIPANLKKPEKFLELFGGETNYGLYPRFIFGYCDKPWRYEEWDNPFKSMAMNFPAEDEAEEMAFKTFACTVVTSIEEKAEAMLDQWNPPVPDAGRLRYNAKKVALLTASANSETTVTAECMRKALLFMEWQIDIRKQFKPGEATDKNKEAQFTEILLDALERKGADKNWTNWRRLALDLKWDKKVDVSLQLRTVKSLVALGRLLEEEEEDDEPKRGRKMKYPRVKLRK